MIHRFVVLVGLTMWVAQLACADLKDVYTIRDIEVSEQAPTVIEAQENAFAVARTQAANAMIRRITLSADRQAAGGLFIDSETAQGMASAVDVQEESRGGGRYVGKLSVVLNPRLIRAYLNARNVPFVDSQAPLAMLVPVGGDLQFAWSLAWGENEAESLTPYVSSVGAYSAVPLWEELESEIVIQGASRAIIAVLEDLGPSGSVSSESQYRVRLTAISAGTTQFLGQTGVHPDLESAVAASKALLANAWKSNAVIRSGEETEVTANVFFTSIVEWNALRRALAQSPRVSRFDLEALARDGAVVNFTFAGDIERLVLDLRQRGVALDPDAEAGWIMTSAIQAVQ